MTNHSTQKKLRYNPPLCKHKRIATAAFLVSYSFVFNYMPIPIPPAGIAGASSLMFATADSVVRKV
ncbi:MAG: hypothetical protein IJ420_05580, partial [Lachnospiraceae bacterium]|nr:hypothetical protein [Lachnospiraceae bacterium]